MDIATYRAATGLSLEALAAKVKRSKGHLHQIEREMRCSAALALAIEQATEGKVDAASLNPAIAAARKTAA